VRGIREEEQKGYYQFSFPLLSRTLSKLDENRPMSLNFRDFVFAFMAGVYANARSLDSHSIDVLLITPLRRVIDDL
jgi:hypothetical protein